MSAFESILVFANTSITLLVCPTSNPYWRRTEDAMSALSAILIFVAAAKFIVPGKAFMISLVLKPACHNIVIPSAASFAVNFVFAPSSIARSLSCLNWFCTSFVSPNNQRVAFAVLICFSNSENVSIADHTLLLIISPIQSHAIADHNCQKLFSIHFVAHVVVFDKPSILPWILLSSAVALSCASNISFML